MLKYFLFFILLCITNSNIFCQSINSDTLPISTHINHGIETELEGVISNNKANKWEDCNIFECGNGKIMIPKFYHPKENINEQWKAEFWEIESIRLTMFDNKGKQILYLDLKTNYMAEDINRAGLKHKFYDLSWIGQYQGNDLPTGFYTYILEIVDTNNSKCRKSAQVFLNQ